MKTAKRAVGASMTLSVVLAAIGCGDGRGGEVPRIRAALQRLPGVRVVDVVGSDEMWPFFGPEDIRADMQVGQTGRLLLCDLTLKTVTDGGPFILGCVGEWSPRAEFLSRDSRARFVAGCPNSVDVKPGSAFVALLPFPLNSPAGAITNYQQLEALISSWPDSPRCQTKPGAGQISYSKSKFVG